MVTGAGRKAAGKKEIGFTNPPPKGRIMSKIIVTHAVADAARWTSFESERRENLGAFASEITSYRDPKGGNTVAVAMTVHDAEGLQAFLQSDACLAIMKRHGIVQPVTVLTVQD